MVSVMTSGSVDMDPLNVLDGWTFITSHNEKVCALATSQGSYLSLCTDSTFYSASRREPRVKEIGAELDE